jgi:hypothetical protein
LTDAAFCENCGTDRDQYGSPDRRLFHRCASCRLEVCPDCWNRGRDLCLDCAPFSVGVTPAGRAPAAAGAPTPLSATVAAQASGWTLIAPDDSPGVPAAAAPAALTTASVFETVAASRIRLGGTLAAIRRRGIAGLGAVASGLGKPVRMATHAVLLLCLTTLGLLVTWQLVSFAGTALPPATPPGAALGADPGASATASDSPTVGTTPVPVGGITGGGVPADHDRGQGGSSGGDGSHGGAGPTPRVTPGPTATAGASPTDGPTATPTPTDPPAPTPTDTPTAAPTDTSPPPPTDTPEPPPTDTPAP